MSDQNQTSKSKSDDVSFSDLLQKKFSYGTAGDSTRGLVDDDEYNDPNQTEIKPSTLNSRTLESLGKDKKEIPLMETKPFASTNTAKKQDKSSFLVQANKNFESTRAMMDEDEYECG
mmetsp:Transcript_11705/g.15433  ORF Transcript_11705/g.15433 Transcript_11705/m.15433 type:complete len:117 (-) Transcript_11705:156-506(-)|eukprot:CAMPEP_0195305422 /NCGR_PEP_ID=MMETSP0707-20130614/36232_1 /TAXON_ID=33640 /ORGANISM="Asterionellopsis glacialis, Strain CCMP134" /LENGTH=116 /DNA_ID=CAMNT_0040369531 /DNA_START=66 /DNA_END=416 /DNA_ORIENTATION=+